MQAIATKIIDTLKGTEPGTKLTMDDFRKMVGDPEKVAKDSKKNNQVYYARRVALKMGLLERLKPNEFNATGTVNIESPKRQRKPRRAEEKLHTSPANENGNGSETTVHVPMKVRVVKGKIEGSVFGQKVHLPLDAVLQGKL